MEGYGCAVDRRTELADQALNYVLLNGLIGLSLRPLAAALGTSDRMLIYHFTSKERLVEAILERAQQHLADSIDPPGPEVGSLPDLINYLWAALNTPAAMSVTRLYLETCMLAVQNPQQWSSAVDKLRGPWRAPLRTGLVAFGITPAQAEPVADFILATLDGLALDRLTASDPGRVDAAAAAFAELLAAAYRTSE
jgi:AcrR family transcriptional regulator